MSWALSLDTADITRARQVAALSRPLEDGEVRLVVRRFALTANVVTYAAFGAAMRYWDFFPAPEGEGAGAGSIDRAVFSGKAGRLPVWGFADVAESRCAGLAPGERIYGYLPAAAELIVRPGRLTDDSFVDASLHRAELPAVYNRYVRCAADPAYTPEGEAAQMVHQPLFITAFLIDLHLRDAATPDGSPGMGGGLDSVAGGGMGDGPGPRVITLTSASSKTALALAFLLNRDRREGVLIEALTSARNAELTRSTRLYDAIRLYDEARSIPAHPPRLIIDFAGDRLVTSALHETLAETLIGNIRVGGAHWENSAPPRGLPGPKPVFFFAPDHVRMRTKAWGPADFTRRHADAWRAWSAAARTLFETRTLTGPDGALSGYQALVSGTAPARDALVVEV